MNMMNLLFANLNTPSSRTQQSHHCEKIARSSWRSIFGNIALDCRASLAITFSLLVAFAAPSWAAIETSAPQALLVDFDTGTVLFEKNADEEMVPSSMTKIVTSLVAFDRLKKGEVKPDTTFRISEKAWRKQGSRMYVDLNSDVSVDDLLNGVVTQSGNDASIALAEGLSGSEEVFAETMNETAKKLGATHTHFVNATGWPDEDHHSTARDLVLISTHLIKDHPDMYKQYYGKVEFTYNNIKQGNRNPLLYETGFESDGLKTGYTDAGGYGVVGTAVKDGRRLIVCVNGLKTAKERSIESKKLLVWGFAEFKNVNITPANQPVETADVWGGAEKTVQLAPLKDTIITLPRRDAGGLQAKIVYEGPLQAPIAKDQQQGYILISDAQGKEQNRVPLYATKEVARAGFFTRVSNAFSYLVWGKNA